MNFHEDTLRGEEVSVLIGFIPKLTYSDEKIKAFMHKCKITTKTNQKSALTVLNRYVENICLERIIKPILEANKNGPLKLLIGTNEYDTMPVFHTYIGNYFSSIPIYVLNTYICVLMLTTCFTQIFEGDNMGAMDVMGIRSFKCNYPCRFCAITRENLWNIENTSTVRLRQSWDYRKFLSPAFDCFCKVVKGNLLSPEEADILNKCKKYGVHPILPALLLLEEPFPMFTAYTYAPADLLHTFLSGMMRDWIVTTEVFGKAYINMYLTRIYVFYTFLITFFNNMKIL
jgi:hypothetical protein